MAKQSGQVTANAKSFNSCLIAGDISVRQHYEEVIPSGLIAGDISVRQHYEEVIPSAILAGTS